MNAQPQRATQVSLCGSLVVDHDTREVRLGTKPLELTALEFNLLSCLVTNRDRVLSKRELAETVWGYSDFFDPRALEAAISRLRAKLGDSGGKSRFIQTIRSVGYRFRCRAQWTHVASLLYDGELRLESSWVRDDEVFDVDPADFVGRSWFPSQPQVLESDESMRELVLTLARLGLRSSTWESEIVSANGELSRYRVESEYGCRDDRLQGVFLQYARIKPA